MLSYLVQQSGIIHREMLTRETALKADVFALGVTAIQLVGQSNVLHRILLSIYFISFYSLAVPNVINSE